MTLIKLYTIMYVVYPSDYSAIFDQFSKYIHFLSFYFAYLYPTWAFFFLQITQDDKPFSGSYGY